MIKILFVCHGNICRSPMGDFAGVFRQITEGCLAFLDRLEENHEL